MWALRPSPSPLTSFSVGVACGRWIVNMATAAAAGDDLKRELSCAICLDFFKDPVILKCGHNFCRFCICMHWDENGGDYGYQCPQCRTVAKFLTSFVPSFLFLSPPPSHVSVCLTCDKPLLTVTYFHANASEFRENGCSCIFFLLKNAEHSADNAAFGCYDG